MAVKALLTQFIRTGRKFAIERALSPIDQLGGSAGGFVGPARRPWSSSNRKPRNRGRELWSIFFHSRLLHIITVLHGSDSIETSAKSLAPQNRAITRRASKSFWIYTRGMPESFWSRLHNERRGLTADSNCPRECQFS